MNCGHWLADFLKHGNPVLCETVREEAAKMGFSRKQLREAREKLGVKCWNDWAANEGKSLNWFWYLEGGKE